MHSNCTCKFSLKLWAWLSIAVILDYAVFSLSSSWGISARHHAGLLASSVLLATLVKPNSLKDWGWLLATVVLVSTLRGGIIGSTLALTDTLPFVDTTLFSAFLSACVSAIIIQQIYAHRTYLSQSPTALSLVAVGFIVLLRLCYLGLPELIFEEAYYWNYAQHLDFGYLDHPLVTALIIKLFIAVFGNHEFAVRLGAFLCWFITGFYIFRLTKALLGENHASLSLLLVACLPAYFFFGFYMSPDAPLTACWAAAIYYIYRIISHEESKAWYPLAISLGIGMSSKYTIALLGFAFVTLLIADKQLRPWWLRKEPYLALLIVACLFSPVIIWNYLHDWASFTFQSEERANSGFVFSSPRFLANILIFASPIGVLSLLAIIFNRSTIANVLSKQFKLDHAQIKHSGQLAWLGLLPILIFAVLSVARTSKLNWTGPCWLALLPLFTLLVSRQTLFEKGLLRASQVAWPSMIALLLAFYGFALQYLSIGYPSIGYPQNTHLIGWKPFAQSIEQLASAEQQTSGKAVLVVGLDRNRIASGLAFYRTLAEKPTPQAARDFSAAAFSTTSQNLLGDNGLMFEWWFPSQAQAGKTLLLVSDDKDDLDSALVHQHADRLGEIKQIETQKNGAKTGEYFFRFAYNYHP